MPQIELIRSIVRKFTTTLITGISKKTKSGGAANRSVVLQKQVHLQRRRKLIHQKDQNACRSRANG